jgi:flagellar biosynthesis/type III secretory pathway protein FliH
VRALDEAREAFEFARQELAAHVARDSVELAIEIARILVHRELDRERHDIEGIVGEALEQTGIGRGPCIVHLSPDDAARLAGVAFRPGTQLEVDAGLARGDVHISTPQGLLVRDIGDVLRAIAERLREEMR